MDFQKHREIINGLKKRFSRPPSYDDLSALLSELQYAMEDNPEITLDGRDFIMTYSAFIKKTALSMYERTSDRKWDALYWKALKFEAPYLFDSYLIYLERKRLKKDMFYLPKRKQFLKIGLTQLGQDMEDDKLDIGSLSMPPGTQKAQPLYSRILTPSGWKTMGDMRVGEKVISGTGKICNVTGVFPQGKKPIYELTFDDGSKCRCSDEHLWTVQTRDDRKRKNKDGSEKYRTIPLKDMLGNYKIENGKRNNYSIDYVPKIDCFEEKDFLIHPYVLGCLLGNGALSSGNLIISTKDCELLENMKQYLPDDFSFVFKGKYDYRINTNSKHIKGKSSLRKALEHYKLDGLKSIDKHIPKEYLFGSYQQRLDLLRGLMDTDGHASKINTNCSYSTISKQLAKDVKELVNSLGGYAQITKTKAGYKKDGKYIRCNDCYIVIIGFSSEQPNPFFIKRKADRYKPKRKVLKRFITNIKFVEEDECQCIYIDDPCHLYITDNYIITHNTTWLKFFASWVIGRHPDDYNLFYSHSGDITRMFYDGVLDITTNADEYCWSEIFTNISLNATNAKAETINFNKYKPFPNLQCSSVGAKNAGKVRANKYLFCDDLIGGIEEALNKNRLDKLWSIYSVDAKQRKMDGCKEIHIATRWSVWDVIGRIKSLYEGSDRARFIEVPDIDPETEESNFDYDYNGFSVEFFNDQALSMDDISYRCLYKSQPIEREGLLYHEDDCRRYLVLPIEEPDAVLGICDTKDKGSDYMFLPVVYQYGSDYYCVDCICDDNSDYGVQYERCANLIVNHKMQQCEFEHNNGGGRVAYDVNQLVEQKGWSCNITSHVTSGNKETKIIVNADWVKKHVLFKDKSMYGSKDDYGKMMSWLFRYSISGKNDHDDVPDGWAQFALFVRNKISGKAIPMQRPF